MHKGRILAVDDEVVLLRLIEEFLRRRGYEVDTCSDGREALERFRLQSDAYAMVSTDMRLPGMSGEELTARVLELSPRTHVLAISGYPLNLRGLPAEAAARVRYLQKPFSPAAFLQLVEELLEN